MSSDFRIYNDIRKKTKGHESVLSNLDGLGLDENTRALHILWMYPDESKYCHGSACPDAQA